MKTEGEFNAYLSKQLKKYNPQVASVKIADKFQVGISDFLIWANSKSLALETKHIMDLPERKTTKILTHPFSGAQLTFLETISLAGSMGYGLISIDSEQRFYVIHYKDIPSDGNFTRAQFEAVTKASFSYKEIDQFLSFFFGVV